MVFADLPGYGYAKVPSKIKIKWKQMVENYLLNRTNLINVIFIIDIRRGLTDLDFDLKNWLEANNINYILAATKSDKLSQSERNKHMKKIICTLASESFKEVLQYSSKTGKGRKELWKLIKFQAKKTFIAKEST